MQTPTAIDADLSPRLRMAVARLARKLRQQAGLGIGGLTPTQTAAMATLERVGPLTLGELAAAEQVQPPTMTRVIEHLVKASCVERVPDRTDRRVVRARLTTAGRKALATNRSRGNAFLAERLHVFSAEELETLTRALPLLERIVSDDAQP